MGPSARGYTIMTTLINKIDEAVVASKADEGNRWHLGASIIGRPCKRQLWYTFRWAKRPVFEGRMYRLFDRGHNEEFQLAKYLRMADVEIHTVGPDGNQFRINALGGHFGGSMDAAMTNVPEAPDEWMVGEFKTHGKKSFDILARKGVREAKPEHYAQMMVYMHFSGMRLAGYLSVCKDDDRLHFEVIEYNEGFALTLIEQARSIIEADTPPERIAGPDYYLCKWCDFRNICHRDGIPERNCRTCVHVEPVIEPEREDGVWRCKKRHGMKGMREELPCHRLNPAMFNTRVVGKEKGAIDHGHWIDYGPGSEPADT